MTAEKLTAAGWNEAEAETILKLIDELNRESEADR